MAAAPISFFTIAALSCRSIKSFETGLAVAVLLLGLFATSCVRTDTSAQRQAAQSKLAEYELARAVVARSETCFETLHGELRAMVEGGEGEASPEAFAARWGLKRFDPNTGFDDAWAACVGEPSLKDLGMAADETPLHFLEHKRAEWEQAEQAATGRRPPPRSSSP